MAMTNRAPSDKADKIIIRLPDGMRERLQTRAAANGRSMTAEVVGILSAAFGDPNEKAIESLLSELRRVDRQRGLLLASVEELDIRQDAILAELTSMIGPDTFDQKSAEVREAADRFMALIDGIKARTRD